MVVWAMAEKGVQLPGWTSPRSAVLRVVSLPPLRMERTRGLGLLRRSGRREETRRARERYERETQSSRDSVVSGRCQWVTRLCGGGEDLTLCSGEWECPLAHADVVDAFLGRGDQSGKGVHVGEQRDIALEKDDADVGIEGLDLGAQGRKARS